MGHQFPFELPSICLLLSPKRSKSSLQLQTTAPRYLTCNKTLMFSPKLVGSRLITVFKFPTLMTGRQYFGFKWVPALTLESFNRLKLQNGETTGPSLLEDPISGKKIHRFDHERIPERVVHARGAGAHGYFSTHTLIIFYAAVIHFLCRSLR